MFLNMSTFLQSKFSTIGSLVLLHVMSTYVEERLACDWLCEKIKCNDLLNKNNDEIFVAMDCFKEKTKFYDFESIIQAKKAYESASNTLLSVKSSLYIPGKSKLQKKLKYQKIVYECKAGTERPSKSKGVRASSTYKKGCKVLVSIVNFLLI